MYLHLKQTPASWPFHAFMKQNLDDDRERQGLLMIGWQQEKATVFTNSISNT